jgi:uncharacterized lipoprotein YehR (DUF1307 family)
MVKIAELTIALFVVQMLSGCAMSEDKGQASYYEGIASQQDIKKISAMPKKQSSIIIKRSSEVPDRQRQVVSTPKNEAPKLYDKRSAEIINFREHIKIGDQSQCGMVVNIRRPIVKIQMADKERWIKISDIYPANYGHTCRFNTGDR